MKSSIMLIFILFLAFFLYSYLASLPLIGDSALYSQTILEILRTGKATYLGYRITWKSPIFFYIYAFFEKFFNFLSFNPSLMISFPCVIFSIVAIFFFYKICRIFFDEKFSIIASGVFAFNPLSALIFSTPFNEAELLAFLLPSIYFYILSFRKSIFVIPAGILFAFSFGIKSYEALIVPPLAIFYFVEKGAKKQKLLILFLSFLFAIVPMFLNTFVFGVGELFVYDLKHFSIGINTIASFILDFVLLLFPFSLFSFFGLFKKEKTTRFFDFWFLFIFVTMLFENSTPWYYSPLLPALAVLTTTFFRKENKLDYIMLFLIFIASAIASLFLISSLKTTPSKIFYYGGEEEIEAAKILSNKNNIFLIYYAPTFVFYHSFYSNYHSLSVYWKNPLSAFSQDELEKAFNFKGENITSWNKWYYNEIFAIFANPIKNIDYIVLRDVDYSTNIDFFSKNGYYPYVVFSRIVILKKY